MLNDAICFSNTSIENIVKDIETINADQTIHLLFTQIKKMLLISIKIRPNITNKSLYIDLAKNLFYNRYKNIVKSDENKSKENKIIHKRDLNKEIELANKVINSCSILKNNKSDKTTEAYNNFHLESPEECLELLSELDKVKSPDIKISWPREQKRLGQQEQIIYYKAHQKWFQIEGSKR